MGNIIHCMKESDFICYTEDLCEWNFTFSQRFFCICLVQFCHEKINLCKQSLAL